ncbi:MAG: metallophosphoesterase [Simkaniaceae bacterium]
MSKIWAIGDLHLSLGVPEKHMSAFGEKWENYIEKIEDNWKEAVSQEDLVLIPGDISWAMKLDEALIDLNWLASLPGTKLLIKGNHDYWWPSKKKLESILPPSIYAIQNDAFLFNETAIGGVRLWDSQEYSFTEYIEFVKNPLEKDQELLDLKEKKRHDETLFTRDLKRLELSLSQLDKKAARRIAMIHYPPISADLAPSRTSEILEKYKIDTCVFGHLHNVKKEALPFGEKNQVRYILTSADYIDFKPIQIY